MGSFWHFEAILTAKSGLARDAVVNNFAFATDDYSASQVMADVGAAVKAFYLTTPSGESHPVGYCIGSQVSRTSGACVLKLWDVTGHLDGSAVGSPDAVDTFTMTTASTDAQLPAEVATCLSYHSDYGTDVEFSGSTRPRERDRGRIYVGPLINASGSPGPVMSEDGTTGQVFVGGNWRTCLSKAGNELRLGSHMGGSPDTNGLWCVWSKKKAAMAAITSVWVDNAFDTIRKRGPNPTTRTTLP